MSVRIPIFAYGTLMRGHALHGWLEEEKFVDTATLPCHSLISFGAYPALLRTNLPEHKVLGEVWEIAPAVFKQLKEMEEAVGYSTENVTVVLSDKQRADKQVKAFLFATLPLGTVQWEQKKLDKQLRGRAQMHPGTIVKAL